MSEDGQKVQTLKRNKGFKERRKKQSSSQLNFKTHGTQEGTWATKYSVE